MPEPQSQFFDVYRSGLRAMNDIVRSSLETTERLEDQQLQHIRSALEETKRSTTQLGEVGNLGELLAAEAKLAGSQVAHTLEFWSSIWRAAGDTQIAVIAQMQSLASRATEDVVRLTTAQVSSAGSAVQEAAGAARQSAEPERSPQRKGG